MPDDKRMTCEKCGAQLLVPETKPLVPGNPPKNAQICWKCGHNNIVR
jgi:hypothetical protein